jgi:hypothetical protein
VGEEDVEQDYLQEETERTLDWLFIKDALVTVPKRTFVSLELTDYSQVDMLSERYNSIQDGAKKIPGCSNTQRATQRFRESLVNRPCDPTLGHPLVHKDSFRHPNRFLVADPPRIPSKLIG